MSVSDPVATPRRRSLGLWFRSQLRNIAPFATLLCLVIFFSLASPSFLTTANFFNILNQVSITAIIAVGLTFVILCSEIDLSVAAVANVTGIVAAWFTMQESYVNIANIPLPGWIAVIFALAACFSLGLVNAVGVTLIGIPSFIMTLAMMQIGDGISAMLVRGQIAYAVPPLISTLGSGRIGGIPWIVIVAATMLLAAHLVLTYTRFGRYVYMVGGNREAAEYSGVNVKLIIGTVMVIGAVCSGIAGMLGVAYFGSAQQNEFTPYLLDAIAAVVVGGTVALRRARRHRQHHHRAVCPRRPEQRPRPRADRPVPEDPDPRIDPADRADHQRLRAAAPRERQGGGIGLRDARPHAA